MTKLAQGMLDLHSSRGSADLAALAEVARALGADEDLVGRVRDAGTVAHAFAEAATAGVRLGDLVAAGAWHVATKALDRPDVELEILMFDRAGTLAGQAHFRAAGHASSIPRNRRR